MAIEPADQAVEAGDWAAYSKAQVELETQLQKAVELQSITDTVPGEALLGSETFGEKAAKDKNKPAADETNHPSPTTSSVVIKLNAVVKN